MDALISPRALQGRIAAPSSKSDAHRLMILAALGHRPVMVAMNTFSQDVRATAGCLRALGAKLEERKDGYLVHPIRQPAREACLDCGESGSTLRFLLPVAAALGIEARFEGRGRLPERPIGELKAAMEAHGVGFSSGQLPFRISGRLTGGEYLLPGNISSQYITGLLLALPLTGEPGRIRLTSPLESAPYVEMTLRAMARFGIEVHATGETYETEGGHAYRSPHALNVEGDWSNAAFFLCAGALGAPVTVTGLTMDSPQGDRRILELLQHMGALVEVQGDGVRVSPGELRGCEIDVSGIPDLLPVLAATACWARGETRFFNAARLRMKESDRLRSSAAMIRSLGGEAAETPEGLIVKGRSLEGGTVDSFSDHRIAMAAAVAAIGCGGQVKIREARCVAKSYPHFFEDYRRLGGIVDVV